MSSRVEHKTALRRQREAREAAEQQARRRRSALFRLAAVTAAALAAVIAVIVVSRLGGDDDAPAVTPSRQYAGIPQSGGTLGAPSAPATLVEFADLQCPYCGEYSRSALPTVVDRYVRPGKLKLELHVLSFVGQDSVTAGKLAAGAAAQDRLWDFTDAFYANQGTENTGYVTSDFLDEVGRAAGLDLAAAHAAANTRFLDDATATGGRLGVSSTPSFFVRKGDGALQPLKVTALTPEAITAALDKALA